MATAVRVPRIRWVLMWIVLSVLFFFLLSWGFWNDLSRSGFRGGLASVDLGFSLLLGGLFSWVAARQFKPARLTLPLSLETSGPLIVSAAPRMKHTVERPEAGEIVLRNNRSILGAHPTIVVRPLSAASLRIEGPRSQIARLAQLLTGQRLEPDREPSLWEIVIALLLGIFLFVTGVIPPLRGCASIDIPTAGPASTFGYSMRRLCDLWGPVIPVTIGAVIAMLPIAYAVAAWREYRRLKQPSGAPTRSFASGDDRRARR